MKTGSIIFTKASHLQEYYNYIKARGNDYRVCVVSNYIEVDFDKAIDGSSLLSPEPAFRYYNDGEMKKYRNAYLNYLQIEKVNGLVGYLVRMAYEGKDVIIVCHDKEMPFEILDILREFMTEMYKVRTFSMKSYAKAVTNGEELSAITEETMKSMEKFTLDTIKFVAGFLSEQEALKKAHKKQMKEEKKARKEEKRRKKELKKAKERINQQLDNYDDHIADDDYEESELIRKYKDTDEFKTLNDEEISLLNKGIDIISIRNRMSSLVEDKSSNYSYGVNTLSHNNLDDTTPENARYIRTKLVTDNPLIGISEEECQMLANKIYDIIDIGSKQDFINLIELDSRVFDMLLVDEDLARMFKSRYGKSAKAMWLKFYSDKFHVSELTDDEDYAVELRENYYAITEEDILEDDLVIERYFGLVEERPKNDKVYRKELKKKKTRELYKGNSDSELLDGNAMMRPIFINGRFFAPDVKAGFMREYDMNGLPLFTYPEMQKVFMRNQLRGISRKQKYTHNDFVDALWDFADIYTTENRSLFHERIQSLFNEDHPDYDPRQTQDYVHAIQDMMRVVWDEFGDDTYNDELLKTLTPEMLCQLGVIDHPSQGNPYNDEEDEVEYIDDKRYYKQKWLFVNGVMNGRYLINELGNDISNLEQLASDLGILEDDEYFDDAEDAVDYILAEVDERVLGMYFHIRKDKKYGKFVEFTEYPLDETKVRFTQDNGRHRRDDYDYEYSPEYERDFGYGYGYEDDYDDRNQQRGFKYEFGYGYHEPKQVVYDEEYENDDDLEDGDTFVDDDGTVYVYSARTDKWHARS